jgi:hypothetical protein
MAQGRLEIFLYHLQRSVGMVFTILLLRISVYFDEFIISSTETKLTGPLTAKKKIGRYLQSAEDAPLSLLPHCFVWQQLLYNLEQKEMWFVTERHIPRSILICPCHSFLHHRRCRQLLFDWFSCLPLKFNKSIPEVSKSLWMSLLVIVWCKLLFLNRSWSVRGAGFSDLPHFPLLLGESAPVSLRAHTRRILDTLDVLTPTTEAISLSHWCVFIKSNHFCPFLRINVHFHTRKNKNYPRVQNRHALAKDTSC